MKERPTEARQQYNTFNTSHPFFIPTAGSLLRACVLSPASSQHVLLGMAVFQMMDTDNSGTVNISEICIVHDSDKNAMLGILDGNGDGEVDPDEWKMYLEASPQHSSGFSMTVPTDSLMI